MCLSGMEGKKIVVLHKVQQYLLRSESIQMQEVACNLISLGTGKGER